MQWYVTTAGKTSEPNDERAIVEAIRTGLDPSAMICEVGKSEWRALASHPAFAAALAQRLPPPPPPTAAPAQTATAKRPDDEQTIFQDAHVTITTTRALLGGVTYAMANITSVRQLREERSAVLLLFGILGVAVNAGCVFVVPMSNGLWELGLILGLMSIAMCGWWFFQKDKHWVRIGTAGAESNAVWSHDPNWTGRVVAAINEAMVRRG